LEPCADSLKKNQVQQMSSVGSVPANSFLLSEGDKAEVLDATELAELHIFTIMFLYKDICT
jgi:hypothetical protein